MWDITKIDVEQLRHYEANETCPITLHRGQTAISSKCYEQRQGRDRQRLDTPSTNYEITKPHHFGLKERPNPIPNHPQQDSPAQQRPASLILSLKEIKQVESRTQDPTMLRSATRSENGRKIFVSIAKSNKSSCKAGEERKRVEASSSERESLHSGRKIMLTKYL